MWRCSFPLVAIVFIGCHHYFAQASQCQAPCHHSTCRGANWGPLTGWGWTLTKDKTTCMLVMATWCPKWEFFESEWECQGCCLSKKEKR